jgi:hypothetical protein
MWPGPNSNTFAAWVLREAGVAEPLDPRGIGRNYRTTAPLRYFDAPAQRRPVPVFQRQPRGPGGMALEADPHDPARSRPAAAPTSSAG